ncbi:hypothetical protein RND81_13G138500 [Saponaria officinalis]|uniref:YGGT family protein n=1 Tax=Saponaria officinalis TaxID=3572 RepID=A0AAW1H170_SAPOF
MATLSSTAIHTFLRPIHTATTHLRRTNPLFTTLTHLPTTTPRKPYSLKPLSISNSSSATTTPQSPNPNPNPQIIPLSLLNSTKTLTTLLAISISIAYKFIKFISAAFQNLAPSPETLQIFHDNVFPTVGPMLFAASKGRPSGYLNTPLTVVASGMAKWLDIYSGVLMVRVLLSWFPNIPWDRQPLSAIRDLCDPYLNLFRNIIPPIFDTLDVSPLLAFAVLGTLGSILSGAKGAY